MKIIFLDIDGVLNSELWNKDNEMEINEGKFIDPQKVRCLSRIINETEAKIVLHSGWRFWFDGNIMPLRKEAEYIVEIFKNYDLNIYDKTPDLTTVEIRKSKKFSIVKAQEILLWLDQHDNIEKYVIFDDLDLNNKETDLFHIKIDGLRGLTKENVEEAIRMLNYYDK